MVTTVVLLFLVLVGPLALVLGADSRLLDDRDLLGWWPGGWPRSAGAPRRARPARVVATAIGTARAARPPAGPDVGVPPTGLPRRGPSVVASVVRPVAGWAVPRRLPAVGTGRPVAQSSRARRAGDSTAETARRAEIRPWMAGRRPWGRKSMISTSTRP